MRAYLKLSLEFYSRYKYTLLSQKHIVKKYHFRGRNGKLERRNGKRRTHYEHLPVVNSLSRQSITYPTD